MENVKGKAKESAGKVAGDQSRQTEGRADQAKADLKQSGEKIKDALRD